MSSPSIWTILGIPPSHDHRDIRRAYAKKLKVTNPEDDPEGFKTLRTAYEYALDDATRHQLAAQQDQTQPEAAAELDVAEGGEAGASEPAPEPPEIDKTVAPIVDEVSRVFFETVQRLEWQLHPDSDASDDDRKASLDAILSSPMLDSIDARERTEFWLAKLASHTIPQSDVLVSQLIDYFDWNSNRFNRPQAYTVRVVRQREIDLEFLRAVKQAGNGYTEAWRLLSRPPQPHTLWQRLWPEVPHADIARFLHQVRTDHPTVIEDLDPDSVDQWTKRVQTHDLFDKVRTWLLLLTPAGIMALLCAWLNWGPHPGLLAILAAIPILAVGGAMGHEHIYARVRRRWEANWELRQNGWLAFGWGPALCLILCLAATPVSPWTTGLVCVLSTGVVWWATVTGEPDKSQGSWPWQVRVIGAEIFLLAWWFCLLWYLPPPVVLQMMPAVIAASLVSGFGQIPLFRLWISFGPWARRAILFALIVGMIGTIGLVATDDIAAQWRSPVFAWVAILILLHRVPTLGVSHWLNRGRNVAWGLAILIGSGDSRVELALPVTSTALLLLAGLGCIMSLYNNWRKRGV